MFNRRKKHPCLAWLLIFAFLMGFFPSAVSAAPVGSDVSTDWIRSTYRDPAIPSRLDDLPTVDRAGNVYTVDGQGYLYCIQPDRTLKWKLDLGQKGNYWAMGGVGPVLDQDGNCYIASANKQVYAISPEGQVIWTYAMKEAVAVSTSPVLSADESTLYVASGKGLYALRTRDEEGQKAGTSRWSQEPLPLSGTYKSTPVVAGDIIYVPSYNFLNFVNPEGTLKKSLILNNNLEMVNGGPITGDTYLTYSVGDKSDTSTELRAVAGSDNGLYLLTTNYKLRNNYQNRLWHFNGDGKVEWYVDINHLVSAPAYDRFNDTIYYRTGENKLYARSGWDGRLLWDYQASGELSGDPAPYNYRGGPAVGPDGTIYVNIGERIYAFAPGASSGNRLKWKSVRLTEGAYMQTIAGPGPQGQIYATISGSLIRITDPDFEPVAMKLELADQADQSFSMLKNGKYQLSVHLLDTYGGILPSQSLKWESMNPDVVKAENGLLTALSSGTANVKVSYPVASPEDDNLALSVQIKVLNDSQGVNLAISPANPEIFIGEKKQLQALITDKEGKAVRGEALEWKSDTQPVATVDGQGLVSAAQQTGSTRISVRVPDHDTLQTSTILTVKEWPVEKINSAKIKSAISLTANLIKSKSGSRLSDWEVFALNAAGQEFDKTTYLNNLRSNIQTNGVGAQFTDSARTAIGVISAGGNPRSFSAGTQTYDFIQNVATGSLGQGINAAIWGLIALDSTSAMVSSSSPNNREALITHILTHRVKEGWSFSGGLPDVDMTGMALYALAPYRDRPEVKSAGEEALKWLSQNQLPDGRFGSWGTSNCESTAQAIMGITAWGLDPQGPDYTKTKGNAVTALLSYQATSGAFKHVDMEDLAIATPQGLEALAALARYLDKGRSDIFENIGAYTSDPGVVTLLKISPATLEIEPGKTIHLKATDQKGNSVDAGLLSWSSSDPEIARIDESGILTALKPGAIDAAVTLKGKPDISAAVRITVVEQVFEIMAKGEPAQPVIGAGGIEREVKIRNISAKSQAAVIITVLYQTDTRSIVQQSYLEKNFSPGEEYTFNGGFLLPTDGKEYEIKVFIWDSWLKGRPLEDVNEP